MQDKTVQISAYVLVQMYDKLKAVAVADDRSINYVVVQAVREFIAKPENVRKWSANVGPNVGQVDLVDAIANAVKAGPVTTAQKQARARKGLADRAARMADRASKHK